jgi:Doubled CXXCH motif (Paired_CXXCH_1)
MEPFHALIKKDISVMNCLWSLLATFSLTVMTAAQTPANSLSGLPGPKPAEAKAKLARAKGPVANNSRCLVCHINFAEEPFALAHAQANIACEQCHGASKAHAGDEDNVTPPEIMFPKAKVNAACLKCHGRAQLSDTHKPVLDGTETANKYCTDCHGEHRIRHRSRNWNKETGKLLPLEPKPTAQPTKAP